MRDKEEYPGPAICYYYPFRSFINFHLLDIFKVWKGIRLKFTIARSAAG